MALNLPAPATLDECLGPDRTNAGQIWDDWIERLENYIVALGIADNTQKRAILLHMCGPLTHRDFKTLANTGADYDTAKTRLTEHFRPQINVEYEKAKFRSMRQLSSETVAAYHTRLKKQAVNCEFGNANLDNEIKSHIIQTTTDSKLRRKGLRETLTLAQVLTEGRNNELSSAQNQEMEHVLKKEDKQNTVNAVSIQTSRPTKMCRNCGLNTYPHPGGYQKCPAFGQQCHICGKSNHFAKVCHNGSVANKNTKPTTAKRQQKAPKPGQYHRRHRHPKVQMLEENASSDEEFVFSVDKKQTHDKGPRFILSVSNVKIVMTADSASSCSTIDEHL